LFNPKNPLDLTSKPLIGMIHLPPILTTFKETESIEEILSISIQDAITLKKAGFDAVLIENFHDHPYPKYRLDDTRFLLMDKSVERIVSKVNIASGINILRNACVQALIMSTVNRCSFIRCNIWEGAYVTDQGIIESVASEVKLKQQEIQSQVIILADVHVKHATPLGNFTLFEAAKHAQTRGGADAVIISGRETGKLVEISELKQLNQLYKIKPILGSGLSIENLPKVFPYISGAIVGTSIKTTDMSSPIDLKKAKNLATAWKTEKENYHD
jgi:membrane complex biogenesis BtpA family protein